MALDLIKAYALAAMLICTICTLVLSWSCLSTECERIPVAMDRHTSRDGRSLLGDATEHKKTLPRTFLLALVMSGPNETDARDVIRRTWILLNKKGAATFSYRFPIGTKGLDADVLHALAVENQRNGDLALIDNLADSYDNLARKTLASMQHAVKSFDFDFVLKLGGGYVLAAELVQFLASNARLLKMYKNEDVSVGAWLAGLNVKYVHDPRFDTEWTSRGCHNEYLITHKHTARQLHDFYDNLLQQRPLCNKEFRIRPSYVYNWAVPPSECCARINGSRIP